MTVAGTSKPYEIFLASSAQRSLRTLPAKVAAACWEFIHGPLADNPQRVGKPLKAPLEGQHSARRGPYRVVYHIDDVDHIVAVVGIIHQAKAYRPRELTARHLLQVLSGGRGATGFPATDQHDRQGRHG